MGPRNLMNVVKARNLAKVTNLMKYLNVKAVEKIVRVNRDDFARRV